MIEFFITANGFVFCVIQFFVKKMLLFYFPGIPLVHEAYESIFPEN